MRTVLYTHDFEPITVLELKPWHLHYLRERGRVELAVFPPMKYEYDPTEELPTCCHRVTISAQPIEHRGVRHLLLFTKQEEVAMLLDSSFLPGQIKELREAEREAFARGVLTAFEALSPGGN